MKTNKLLQSAFVAAVTVAACAGIGSADASASSISKAKIAVDTDKQQMTIKELDNTKQVFYGVASVAKDKKKGNTKGKDLITVASWDSYDYSSKGVTIDLSKLNRAKDNFIEVKSDKDTDPVIIKIPKVDSYVRATFTAYEVTEPDDGQEAATEGCKLVFESTSSKSGKTINYEAVETGKWEYRTTYGDWTLSTANDDFALYQQQGATLYIRKAAETDTTIEKTETPEYYTKSGDLDSAIADLYLANAFPGKEAKVTIPKIANAPKVTVDYVKGSVTLPKNTEYRCFSENKSLTKWVANSTNSETLAKNKKAEVITLSALIADKNMWSSDDATAVIEIRTVAAAAAGKTKAKAASKAARISLTRPAAVTANGNAAPADTDKVKDIYGTAASIAMTAKVIEKADDETLELITAEYTFTKSKKGKKPVSSQGLKFTNTDTASYEICFVTAKEGQTPASPDDTENIATQKSVTVKKAAAKAATVSVKASVAKEGTYVFIRKLGEKASQTWVGAWTAFGTNNKLAYPEVKEITPEPTPTPEPDPVTE